MNNLIKRISMFLLLVLCLFSFYNVKADTKNIEVTNISIKDKSSTIAVETPVISSNVITSNVTFNKVNDFVSFDITLKNNEEDKYKIISITDNNTNENIKLDYTYNDNFIIKGESTTIGVKLSYIKKLVNQDKISLNDLQITINLENEKGDSGEIIINPTTGDNLYIHIGILIISFMALVLIVTKKKIKGIKVGNILLVLAILLIPFGVFANEKFELKLRFNSIDIKGEFEKYNITIDPKDGNNPITREVTYGEKIGSLPEITKPGYNFNKWIDNNENEVTEDTVITGPISVEATFTPITYSITYNLDGGSVSSNPESYTIESDDITLNNPSKEGYTFSGWTGSNGETLETLVTITKGSTGDKTYKANYSASQNTSYKVIHKYQNLDLTTYTESVDNLEGATDTEVLAPIKSKTGFVDPVAQKVVIKADGSSEVTYIYLRKTYDFNITDRTYIDSTSTIDGNYPYETEIKVKAIERAGYDFKWSDNVTDLERTITLDKNLSLTPIYTAKTNTKYTVVHKKQKLDLSGYEIADSFIEEGTTDTPVTPEVIDYTGFTSPATITDTIKGDGSLVIEYLYTRNKYTLTIETPEYVTEDKSGDYYYEEEVNLSAIEREGYTFAGWSNGESTKDITITMGAENINIKPLYTANTDTPYTVIYKEQSLDLTDYEEFYTDILTGTTGTNVTPNVIPNVGFVSPDPITDTIKADGSLVIEYLYDRESYEVSFNTDGGTIIPSQTVYYEGLATLPTEPTKDGYNFAGWYTDDSLTTEFDFSTPILGITTIYAKWEKNIPEGIICKKATTLHTSECTQTSGGCNAAGYTASGSKGTTTITFGTISYGSLVAGNAFDCDVNGDGTFDDVYERFYYLRTTTEDNAVLINGYNYEGDDGYGLTESVHYDVALTYLPKTSDWTNVPITFGEYAARFVTMEDLTTATGESSLSSTGALNEYPYLLENTTFVAPKDSGVRSGIWLEIDNNKYYRIHSQNRLVEQKTNSSENAARPVIEIPLQNVEQSSEQVNKWTIDFETNGGEAIDPIIIDEGDSLGVLPTTTKAGHEFAGWYYEPEFINEVKATDTFNYDTTLYAKWDVIAVAEINGTYYNTVQLAMNAVPTDGTLTTVNLLKDVTLPSTITLTGTNHELKNILFNLNGFTISYASKNVIKSKARMEITNGTINCSAGSGAVDVEVGGNMVINNVTINATGTRQAVYNNGGNLTIKGNSYLQNKEQRAAVHNLNGGTTIIESGTIVSSGTIGAVYNEKGTVIIGTEDNLYDETSPVLQGASYGLATKDNTTTNKIYDGILKGETNAVDDETRITDTEANAVKVNDVDGNYKILYYTLDSSKYKITLDADGGTLDKSYILVEMGEPVGELPSPTKGIYTFTGWYDEEDDLVDENTIPTKNETYTAKWVYEASDEIVNFNITNDVMTTYYNNINTWKNDESTFEDTMKENFNNYGCFSCTAPSYQDCPTPTSSSILCDQPKGYETGITTGLKVYNSDETTKEKGTEVTYATINNGTIYNLIPGETYYWESTSDSNVHGLVKVSGNRRIISSNVRNVRDIGGLEVDVDNDGTADGTLKYGKIFRGAKLSTKTSDADELTKLGITEEVDLRGSSTDVKLPNYVGRTITNYLIYPDTYAANYATLRQALTDTMQDVVSGENIFFHCKIGTDRTGTLAYFLEGLLGVSEEDRLEDYELSFFYGLLNRHRYHDNLSGSQINPRFTTMYNTYPTNQDIYDFYMHGSTNQEADQKLIEDFRNAMINEY